MKYLAFDIGTQHTGVALSEEGLLAQGKGTILASDQDSLVGLLCKEIDTYKPDVTVVGIPETGPAREFIEKIVLTLQAKGYRVETVNEDFTSRDAVKALVESGAKLRDRRSREHEVAAAAILQSYLDQLE